MEKLINSSSDVLHVLVELVHTNNVWLITDFFNNIINILKIYEKNEGFKSKLQFIASRLDENGKCFFTEMFNRLTIVDLMEQPSKSQAAFFYNFIEQIEYPNDFASYPRRRDFAEELIELNPDIDSFFRDMLYLFDKIKKGES